MIRVLDEVRSMTISDDSGAEASNDGPPSTFSDIDRFEKILREFFCPLLEKGSHGVDSTSAASLEQWTEVSESVTQLAQYLSNSNRDTTRDAAIQIPSVDVSRARECEETQRALAATVAEWTETLSKTLQEDTSAQLSVAEAPLAELDHWRQRLVALSTLSEQLQSEHVTEIVSVVESSATNKTQTFAAQLSDLAKLVAEARDNVKFLATLERHFKTLSTGSMASMRETLPPMMNSLRMIWILSRHYGDDQHMGGLMKKIAQEIGHRVENAVEIPTVFKGDAEQTIAMLNNAEALTEAWYRVYMEVREAIEASRRDARWEFPRGALFDRTQHIALVCRDLAEMVEIVDDFHKFLGPELKSVIGDASGIDQILETVVVMCESVENASFSVFDVSCAEQWSHLKSQFHRDNESIKHSTRELIDASFRKLRSASAACALLQSFESIQSRGAVRQQIMSKARDVLSQFSREIDVAKSVFDVHHQSPPITRNQPPVAGSVQWSRRLFARIKHTMEKIASFREALQNEPIGMDVSEKFMSFARRVMVYEKERIKTWEAKANGICMAYLKQPLLTRDATTGSLSVNFSEELKIVIKETKCLDKMGFELPEIALNVALQDQNFKRAVEELQSMLLRYNEAYSSAERS